MKRKTEGYNIVQATNGEEALQKVKEVKPGHLELHCNDHEDFFTVAKWLGKIATLAAGMENQLMTN